MNTEAATPNAAMNNQNLMDFLDNLDTALKHQVNNSPGLAIGSSSKAKVLIANTVEYMINGVRYQKTTAEIAFTATTHDITADADNVQEACYLLSIDENGTVTITMGDVATGSGEAEVPDTPEGEAALGYLRLAVAAGSTDFDASTDELDEAHLTDTYVNLGFRHERFDAATL